MAQGVRGAWCAARCLARWACCTPLAERGTEPGAWRAACQARRPLRGVQPADLSLPLALSRGREGKRRRPRCFHREIWSAGSLPRS